MNIDKLSQEVISETDKIINKFGPRLAGTKASLDTADYLFNEAKEYSDQTFSEDFYINKGAFLGWINLLVICYLLGFVSFLLGYVLRTWIVGIISFGVGRFMMKRTINQLTTYDFQ